MVRRRRRNGPSYRHAYRRRVTGMRELRSMHLALPRETPEAFRGTPELHATATYRFPQQALKSHIPTTLSPLQENLLPIFYKIILVKRNTRILSP